MRKRFLIISYLLGVLCIGIINGQAWKKKNPDPLRFRKEVNAFVQYDKKNSFPENAILFLGSSSIRKWWTHEAFPQFPVINRGFGGSHLSDVLYYYDVLLKKYQPSLVVFYEGDNDIAFGKSPQQVFEDYCTFVNRFRHDFPSAKLIFISIKPSLLRWKVWPQMQAANRKIEAFNRQYDQLYYVNLANVLLKNGKPDSSLYAADGLHLNAKGYALWNARLKPWLQKLWTAH